MIEAMVSHIVYHEEHYTTDKICVEQIRRRIDFGWVLTQIRGPAGGPFVAVYRIELEAGE